MMLQQIGCRSEHVLVTIPNDQRETRLTSRHAFEEEKAASLKYSKFPRSLITGTHHSNSDSGLTH
jgi:hypothetical protein